MAFVDVTLLVDSATDSALAALEWTIPLIKSLRARLVILDLCALDENGIASDPHSEAFAVDARSATRRADLAYCHLTPGFEEERWHHHIAVSDLIVVAAELIASQGGPGVLDVLLRFGGTPVLISAPTTVTLPMPRRIVLPWAADRGSARALLDALPLLRIADDVLLLPVGPEVPAAENRAADAVSHLKRHGVVARIEPATPGLFGADAVAACVQRVEADLVVFGLGGPPLWPHSFLPPMTRKIIEGRTVQVFLSP